MDRFFRIWKKNGVAITSRIQSRENWIFQISNLDWCNSDPISTFDQFLMRFICCLKSHYVLFYWRWCFGLFYSRNVQKYMMKYSLQDPNKLRVSRCFIYRCTFRICHISVPLPSGYHLIWRYFGVDREKIQDSWLCVLCKYLEWWQLSDCESNITRGEYSMQWYLRSFSRRQE